MMIRFLALCFFIVGALSVPAVASSITTPRTQATLLSDVKTIHAGQPFWAVLHIKLQPGWHTYWKNAGDSGIPPGLEWTLPNGFSAGEVQFLAPSLEKIGPLVDYAYSDDAYYPVSITPPLILRSNATAILMLKAHWLVCNDVCIPESGDFSLMLPATAGPPEPSGDAPLIGDVISKLPSPLPHTLPFSVANGEVHFVLKHSHLPYEIKNAEFFPATDGLISNASLRQVTVTSDSISFTLKQAEGKLVELAQGVISLFFSNGERKDYVVTLKAGIVDSGAKTSNYEGLIAAMVSAFLGGLILNLMPCVFPILSLKALAVAKKAAAHPDTVRKQGLAYALGATLSFLGLAFLLILLQKGGAAIGWGYQMQSPVFVASLAFLLLAIGLNLSGYFELPTLFGNAGTAEDSTIGSFVTGILAVMVATPCTAPFMATAVGFALTGGTFVIIAVFASLGIGFAAPFLLISLYPKLVSALPKPGAWMLTFKQFLAFPIYLTVVWLLWVLTREAGADAAAIALLGMVAISFALWLWQHTARVLALLIAIAGVGFALTMMHPAPPSPKAEPFSQDKLSELRKAGGGVFVDATADWCITCKVNETVALSSPKVMEAFKQKHITYMVADWTHGDMDITHYLESFGRRGVPIYVYYPPQGEPKVLPQLLTESVVLEAIQ